MKLEDKVGSICNYEYKYFLNKENVIGVALGYKTTGGFNTLNKCIKVLVSRKVPLDGLKEKDIIPKEYKGINTDVIETGIIKNCGFTEKIRPVLGGYSTGPASRRIIGTFGCLVTERGKYYVLGCNHVLAGENTVSIGTPVLQPSVVAGGKEPRDNIAKLSRYIPLEYETKTEEPVNFVDCAIAEVQNINLVSPNIAIVGGLKGSREPVLDLYVKKVGCITELTCGLVDFINTTIKVLNKRGYCLFKNQIGATAMGEDGDSGAILLDDNKLAVGLLIGGNGHLGLYSPMEYVLKALGVKIVSNS